MSRQRQESDRPVGQEPLPGGFPMPQRGTHGRHQRLLPVITAVALDPGELPHPGVTAVGAHHQACPQPGTAQVQRHPITLQLEILQHLGAKQRESIQRGHTRIQAALDDAVLHDMAQGVGTDIGAVKMHAAAAGSVPDMHLAKHAGAGQGQRIPHVDGAKYRFGRNRDGTDAKLPLIRQRRWRITGLDDRHSQAGFGDRAGQRRSRHTSAHDRDVVVHSGSPRASRLWRPASPMATLPKRRLAGGNRSKASSPRSRAATSGANRFENRRTRASVARDTIF